MPDTQSFVTFHPYKPVGPYSPTYAFHAPCDTQLLQITEGEATLYYCPTCKLPDTQALGALLACFDWLRSSTEQDADGDMSLNEFEDSEPGDRPPVGFAYLRIWNLIWGFIPDEEATDEKFGERELIVALLPDGSYRVLNENFPNCNGAGINPGCGKYLSLNSKGVLACPEHGAYDVEDDDPESEDN